MPVYSFYLTSGDVGRIYKQVFCLPDEIGFYEEAGMDYAEEWVDPETEYIKPSDYGYSIFARPEMPAAIDKTEILANGIDVATITGIPVGSSVAIDSEAWAVDDGVFELTVDTPGEYRISISCWPYLDKELIIHAS